MRTGFILLLVLSLAGGCRNPFNPAAEVELASMTTQFGNEWEIFLFSGCCSGGTTINYSTWEVDCSFVVKNKVGVRLTDVNIIYTDFQGNQVTLYKDSGGRNFKFLARLEPLSAGPGFNFPFGEGQNSVIPMFVVDPQVIAEFQAGTLAPQVMFATITFRGVDDNGYDVKLAATMTIKAYGPI